MEGHVRAPKFSRCCLCPFGRADSGSFDPASPGSAYGPGDVPVKTAVHPTSELAHCFLRLTDMPNYAVDRLCRYEATLWRQAGQILFALDALDRRKPWDRRRRFRVGGRQEFPVYDPEER